MQPASERRESGRTSARPGDRLSLLGARILVVEDEVLIGMALQATLEDGGAELIGPDCHVAEALEHAEHEDISAAVLDIQIGRDSIEPVARALAKRRIPFLFYTGQAANDRVRLAWPDAPVLAKSASPRALIGAVEALLAA